MDQENWYRVDNVSKVFLATHSERDTRSIRVSCTLNETIDVSYLEEALKKTIVSRNVFQVRIRRGLFWHYIEHTDVLPSVSEEHDRPCPVLYGKNYRGRLHYSVTYYKSRINVEIFHALTDGTGAMDFLNILVLNYLKIKYPEQLSEISMGFKASEGELEQDGFSKFYDKRGKITSESKKAYHIRGLKLPYNQLQFFKITMPVKKLLEEAKSAGVGLTSYIGARLMYSIYRDMPAMKRNLPVTISVPVNLRNYYETETVRNFFNSISISHVFEGNETEESLAKEFDASLKSGLLPENIHNHMVYYQRLEHLAALRMVPLVIKQPVIKFFARKEAKKVSAVISNLGIMKVPDEIKEYVKDYTLYCSHSELYISMCTYNNQLVMGITTGCRNTSVLKHFISSFSKNGTEVELQATEVVRS